MHVSLGERSPRYRCVCAFCELRGKEGFSIRLYLFTIAIRCLDMESNDGLDSALRTLNTVMTL